MTPSHWARPRTPTAKEPQPAEVPLPSARLPRGTERLEGVGTYSVLISKGGGRLGILLGRSILPTPISPFFGPQAKQLAVFSEWKSERWPAPAC